MKSKRPRNKIYIVSKRRLIRGDKIEKAIKSYKKLLERREFEWDTKWIQNALEKATAKLNKYQIKLDSIS